MRECARMRDEEWQVVAARAGAEISALRDALAAEQATVRAIGQVCQKTILRCEGWEVVRGEVDKGRSEIDARLEGRFSSGSSSFTHAFSGARLGQGTGPRCPVAAGVGARGAYCPQAGLRGRKGLP